VLLARVEFLDATSSKRRGVIALAATAVTKQRPRCRYHTIGARAAFQACMARGALQEGTQSRRDKASHAAAHA
jgi:hypothetical protein